MIILFSNWLKYGSDYDIYKSYMCTNWYFGTSEKQISMKKKTNINIYLYKYVSWCILFTPPWNNHLQKRPGGPLNHNPVHMRDQIISRHPLN